MSIIESVRSLVLDLPPSCVEFWPTDHRYAVVGTYNLEKQESEQTTEEADKAKRQMRSGSLILLKIEEDDVTIVQTVSTPSAILDIHFAPAYDQVDCFGTATSTGSIALYKLNHRYHGNPELSHFRTIQFFSEDILVTAFSWHPQGTAVGMTLSSGQVCLGRVQLGEASDHISSSEIITHDLEAWTLAFLPDGLGLYSGGDDSALHFVELASNLEHYFDDDALPGAYSATRSTPWVDRKAHTAGVTAILPLQANEEGLLVLTGSYDDHIRLMSVSAFGRRKVLAEMNLGGGVWRLKQLDTTISLSENQDGFGDVHLLASCMHAGTRILRLRRKADDDWYFEILAKFEEHKSMNYGSDCQSIVDPKGQQTFITTSFYDRLLCLWKF